MHPNRFYTKRQAVALAALVVSMAAIGAGAALGQATGNTYTGCLQKDGQLVSVAIGDAPAKTCNKNATQISWNETGQPGADGAPGTNGQDGASAYEIWLAQGHSGTEADFLASLKGERGDPGIDGADGVPGDPGADGQDGESAYEIWLSLGNEGTEQDFIDSLQGSPGTPGADASFPGTYTKEGTRLLLGSLAAGSAAAGCDAGDTAIGGTWRFMDANNESSFYARGQVFVSQRDGGVWVFYAVNDGGGSTYFYPGVVCLDTFTEG